MSDFKIICDSLADIPKHLIDKYDIEVVPLTVIIQGMDYKDGVTITNSEFYNRLRETNEIPHTSQATYIQFKEVFEKYLSQGKSILYISGSSKATGTYQSAMMAKNDIGGDITLFDSYNLSYGYGVQVVRACELKEDGYSIESIICELEKMKDNIYVLFAVDTLDYLQQGGRISKSKSVVGHMLNIKPLVEVKDGLVENVAAVRGKKKVFSKFVELIKLNCGDNLSNKRVAIGHGDNLKDLETLKHTIETEFNINNMLQVEIGPSIGSHAGPGTIGICIVD